MLIEFCGQWRNMTPMHRLGDPDELNGLAVFLASDASGFMTGSNVMCDVSLPSSFQSR